MPPTSDNPSAPTELPYGSGQFANVVAAVREMKHPTQIGSYHILELIGEGGMGTVYKAEQREPIHRVVALKIIKLGMDTREVISRFESERQALAVMNHVNVAKVLDAGATETGRPFFVMEYVPGVSITTYADRQRLGLRERLELFMQACAAVQHAHQKAIIHRDLKPSNMLVTVQDDKPLLKVIDFGVAKAVSSRLTDRTFFTETGQLVGTPEYMSPEQAEAMGVDVDTRTDVYSLGVVLYELLSGALPFDPKSLRSAGYQEIQRIIREVDPPAPSTRLSALTETLASIAACRQIEPRKLETTLKGELDWIVMKSLEKDRTRRYESAGALAGDVARYLADEPIAASPPSKLYRSRKFVRRHRWGLGMAAVLAAALGAGLIGTTLGFIRARQQRDEAVAARLAEAEAREYESQTDKFLIGMFTSIDPEEARGREVKVKEILDLANRRIDADPPKHAVVEASLRAIFGRAYRSLGDYEKARQQLQRSVDIYRRQGAPRESFLMHELQYLGLAELSEGKFAEAEASFREALQLHRKHDGPDHADTLAVQGDLVSALLQGGKPEEAEALIAQAMQRMNQPGANVDLDARCSIANTLAQLRMQQGRLGEAEQLMRDALQQYSAAHGNDHPGSLAVMSNLAMLLQQQGRLAEATELLRRTSELSEKVNGPDHPSTAVAENNLALTLDAAGQFDEAEKVYLRIIRRSSALNPDDPGLLVARSNYALLIQKMGRLDDAESSFRDLIVHMKRVLGEDQMHTLFAESNLAMLRAQRGDLAEAEQIFRSIIPRARKALTSQSPATISFVSKFGYVLSVQKKWAEAEPLLAEGYAAAAAIGVTSSQPGYGAAYGACLVHQKKPQEALPILKEAYHAASKQPQPDPNTLARIAGTLALAYDQLDQPGEARKWRENPSAATVPSSQPANMPMTTHDERQ